MKVDGRTDVLLQHTPPSIAQVNTTRGSAVADRGTARQRHITLDVK